MSNYIVVVDIGNTNTHIGLVNRSSRTILSLDIFPTKDAQQRSIDSVVSLLQSMKHAMPIPVVACCVVPSLKAHLSDGLKKVIGETVQWVCYDPSLPIVVNYEDTARFGPDRLANLIYGYEVYKNRDLIIIDVGTAIKVDFLKNGKEFSGGAIFPGISTQIQSLSEHTSQLPVVDIGEIGREFPGLSTESCILTGVRVGIAGAISFLVEKYKDHFNADPLILCTGGSWKYVQEHVDFKFEFIPELTLVGCAFFYGISSASPKI